ncbi:hypothetical protein FAB82_14745 [Glycomyces buryatensis]|uniref:Type II toxin-antitoxin system HicA family toxin n=1 Tax=Glycomyces buryatensis TaxID=2570927 RepID=A0A4S8QCC5_9ACTN|nr:hypothetical protein FAB82_14745 [Glycomyces buryatensis]
MPRHPNKHIRAAIEYMEEKGWKIETSGGHAWGRAFCPGGGTGCRPPRSIWSTPRSPEDFAKQLRKVADECPHGLETDIKKGA